MGKPPLEMLSGVRILSFTQFLIGPAAVQYLSDLGAEAIKIEPPGGAYERSWSGAEAFPGGVSAFYLLAHRNIRSLTLNLKDPAGQEVARRLIKEADVLVQNFRPGVMERFGLGYQDVKPINPGLIYACASGYGMDSPYRDLPGQDLLLQAMCGLAYSTGREGELPTPTGSAIVDQHSAALLAMGILGALFHKQRTGQGQRLEVNMVQGALDLQSELFTYYMNGGRLEKPVEPLGSTFHQAPYGVYETADGYLALSLTPIRTIRQAMGNPPELEPFEDPKVVWSQRNEIRRALAPLLLRRTTREWLSELRAGDVWCAQVNDFGQVVEDPAVKHLQPFMEVDHPQAGKVHLLRHPVTYEVGEPTIRRMPPTLGQDTEEVLADAGYSPAEVQGLREKGAI